MDHNSQASNTPSAETSPNEFKDMVTMYTKNAMSAMINVNSLANQSYAYGYAHGKREAYEDVFKWFTDQHDNTLRYVSTMSFFNYINDKLLEFKSKFAIGTPGDDQMSDGISKLDKLSTSAGATSVEMKSSSGVSSSSSILKNFTAKEGPILFRENRKRRRNPFFSGRSEDAENIINSELPTNLRPENNSLEDESNPFFTSQSKSEQMVYLPKRKKNNW
ncbi:unnamed protein product [Moneuplotes crassus]|uniref:Uncharacterized protein n=1 Tax=Euplotes crassus TaxID=5936 RepID=A0AAD1XRW9_EUPCR|nr:unnamed protein product [Moneuplotes crassus]